MYRCDECRMIIEDFNDLAEDWEGWKVCPHCKGDVEIVAECECGNLMQRDEPFCEKCKLSIMKKFQELLDEFSEDEKKYLNEIYDGKEF